MISLLLTLILGFASDSCNNKDIILILGYNYNLSKKGVHVHSYYAQALTHLLLHMQFAADGACPSASAIEKSSGQLQLTHSNTLCKNDSSSLC